jgi:hypothetical protein
METREGLAPPVKYDLIHHIVNTVTTHDASDSQSDDITVDDIIAAVRKTRTGF